MKEWLRHAARVATMALVALGSSQAAADEPGGFTLEWNAPEDCPDRAAAEAAIRDIVGEAVASDTNPDLVNVAITPLSDGRWEARIVTHGDSGMGHRRFEGPSCERVAEAAILIVAMTLDPMGVAHQVKTARTAARHPAVEPPSTAAERLRPLLGLRVAADVGSLPGPTLGLSGLFGLEGGPVRIEGEGTLWFPRLALTGPTLGSGGEIGLYTGGIRGCLEAVMASGSNLRLGFCVGGEVGVSTGRAVGIIPEAARSGIWAAGLGGLSLRQVNSPGLTYGLSVDLGVPLRRPAFVIDNFGPVFQSSAVVGRASVDLAWIFP